MDLKLDTTTDRTDPDTTLAISQSEGSGEVTNPPVTNPVGPQPSSMGSHTTN